MRYIKKDNKVPYGSSIFRRRGGSISGDQRHVPRVYALQAEYCYFSVAAKVVWELGH